MGQEPKRTGALRLWMVSVIAAMLIVAGCGGGGTQNRDGTQDGEEQDQAQQQQVQGRRIDVASGEFYFDPAEIRVQQGETVTLVLPNEGALTHNISIDEVGVSEDYVPGETAYVTFTPEQTGTFEIYCDEPGHVQSGMVGTLIVE